MKAYLRDDDTLSIVGPQIGWAVLGLVAMAVMMRVDYRYLRLVSVPVYVVALVLLVLVFVPSLNVVVGGSARWLKVGPLPAVHPAEFAKLAMVIYLAHWFAKRGTGIRGLLGRHGPVPRSSSRRSSRWSSSEPDLGTTMVIGLTALTMFFVAGGEPAPPRVRSSGWRPSSAIVVVGLRGYQMDRIRTWLDPVGRPARDGLPHDPGPARAGARRDPRRRARREPAGRRPVPAEREQRLHLRDHRRGVRADRRPVVVILLFVVLAYSGIRVALAAPDTFGALLAAGHHRLALHPGVHQHRRGRRAHPRHRHHAAVHQRRRLVAASSASRPSASCCRSRARPSTRGTWNDAAADRRRAGRAGTSTRPSPWPARSARPDRPTRLSSSGSAAIAGSRPDLVRGAGIRVRRLALRSLRTVDLCVHTVLDPLRLAAVRARRRRRSSPASGRRRSSRPAATWRCPSLLAAAPLRIPVVLWEGNVVPGRAVRATARLADALAVSFEATGRALADGAASPCLRHRHADPRRRRRSSREAARARLDLPAGRPASC